MSNVTLEELLRKIPARSLVQLAESDKNLAAAVEQARTNKKGELKPLASADARKIIQHEIRRVAGKILAESMTVKQRADAVAKLNINHEEQGNNPKSTRVHKKRLLEALEASGVEDFLKENVDVDALLEIGETFDLELSAKATAEKLASQINNQIEYEAAAAFLESFSNSTLLDVAFEMKLSAATTTAANGTVVEAILTDTEIKTLKKPAIKKKAVKVSKTKPKLAKGVTYDDVYQWYTVEELKEFAKENELLVSGTKKELIKRILAWFEGDKENTTVEGYKEKLAAKKEKTEAKKEKSKKKGSTKKSGDEGEKAAKPTKKETAAAKKEAAAAAKKEEAEAKADAEEAEEELDLDNLNNYDLAKLKKYCSDEGITATGNKKQIIEAILAYNAEQEEGEQ